MWIIEKAKALSYDANPSDIQRPKHRLINKYIIRIYADYRRAAA